MSANSLHYFSYALVFDDFYTLKLYLSVVRLIVGYVGHCGLSCSNT